MLGRRVRVLLLPIQPVRMLLPPRSPLKQAAGAVVHPHVESTRSQAEMQFLDGRQGKPNNVRCDKVRGDPEVRDELKTCIQRPIIRRLWPLAPTRTNKQAACSSHTREMHTCRTERSFVHVCIDKNAAWTAHRLTARAPHEKTQARSAAWQVVE